MNTERDLQAWMQKRCEVLGVLSRKLVSPARRGWPDVLMLYQGRYVLVELKTPAGTGRLNPLQEREHERLRAAGAEVHVLDSKEGVERAIQALISGPHG